MAFSAAMMARKVKVSEFSKGLPEEAPDRLPDFLSFFSDPFSDPSPVATQKLMWETSSFKADTLTQPPICACKS
jgi:hypothetical protein